MEPTPHPDVTFMRSLPAVDQDSINDANDDRLEKLIKRSNEQTKQSALSAHTALNVHRHAAAAESALERMPR